MSRKKGKQRALLKTAEEYSSCTTIHGVSYAFDRDLGSLDRSLWTLVVIAFLLLAGCLTYNTWTEWRDGQVTFPGKQLIILHPKGYDNPKIFVLPD